jgi:hypothetical protein
VAADYYRFQLLAGCRGIEIHGHKQHGYPPILVGDVDQRAGRVVLRAWINERAGTKVQGHGLRATFASIAEELVSSALLKRMTNHATVGDVTFGHYVATSEAQLRAGWQAVADFVEEAAKLP